MNNKIGLGALACALAVAPALSKAQDSQELVQLAVQTLASQFNLSPGTINADASRYNTAVFDLEPAYYIRAHSRSATIQRVLNLRAQG